MMNAGTNIEQRSIILVPFPFSDLSNSKKRPALVLSSNEFNGRSEDVICCLITSNLAEKAGVQISNKDMETGRLEFDSRIKPYRLFTVDKNIVYKVLGKLSVAKSRVAIEEISKIVQIK